VSALDRILEVLPPIYPIDESSVMHQFLDGVALDLDAAAEDMDRMRRTHWFELAYRLVDLEKLAALVGVSRRSWETLPVFRGRVRALVDARLDGSVGPEAIRTFVYESLTSIEQALNAVLVPGLAGRDAAAAFAMEPHSPQWTPLRLVENPDRVARSAALAARGGRVPYLYRWTDTNHGIDAAPVTVTVIGRSQGRTAMPVLVNLTTGHAVGYAGVLQLGQRLTVGPADDAGPDGRTARATLDGDQDVTARVFSLSEFALGRPFALADADPAGPLLPVQARGTNDWIYVSGALYGVDGLDATYLQLADDALREGVFDTSTFDNAVYPSGIAATVQMEWTEHEPAAFAIVVPRGVVAVPRSSADLAGEIAEAIAADLGDLHAAGVRSELVLQPFTERQPARAKVTLPWVRMPEQLASAGERTVLGVGGAFGESGFGQARFE